MTTTDVTEQKLSTGLIQCQPWCRRQDGHPAEYAVDQRCESEATDVNLSLHQLTYERGTPSVSTPQTVTPKLVTVYAEQAPDEAPSVHIGEGEWAPIALTLDEAYAVGFAILSLVAEMKNVASVAK